MVHGFSLGGEDITKVTLLGGVLAGGQGGWGGHDLYLAFFSFLFFSLY